MADVWVAADYWLTGWSVCWNIAKPSSIATDNLWGANKVVTLVAGKPCNIPSSIPVSQAVLNVSRVGAGWRRLGLGRCHISTLSNLWHLLALRVWQKEEEKC